MLVRALGAAARPACSVQRRGGMTRRPELAAVINWPDDSEEVVSFGQLAEMPPSRLAGSSIRLVLRCPCCGGPRELSSDDVVAAMRGAAR